MTNYDGLIGMVGGEGVKMKYKSNKEPAMESLHGEYGWYKSAIGVNIAHTTGTCPLCNEYYNKNKTCYSCPMHMNFNSIIYNQCFDRAYCSDSWREWNLHKTKENSLAVVRELEQIAGIDIGDSEAEMIVTVWYGDENIAWNDQEVLHVEVSSDFKPSNYAHIERYDGYSKVTAAFSCIAECLMDVDDICNNLISRCALAVDIKKYKWNQSSLESFEFSGRITAWDDHKINVGMGKEYLSHRKYLSHGVRCYDINKTEADIDEIVKGYINDKHIPVGSIVTEYGRLYMVSGYDGKYVELYGPNDLFKHVVPKENMERATYKDIIDSFSKVFDNRRYIAYDYGINIMVDCIDDPQIYPVVADDNPDYSVYSYYVYKFTQLMNMTPVPRSWLAGVRKLMRESNER